MEAKEIIMDKIHLTGWNDSSIINILTDFINSMDLQEEFREYVDLQIAQEFGFPWDLQSGDEVIWNSDGKKTCLKIITIEYHGSLGDDDCIISIISDHGQIEVFARELE